MRPYSSRRRTACASAAFFILALSACSPAPEPPPVPGTFEPPLVQLQQLVGRSDHLHTDEVRYRASDGLLFHCSYTFGVIDARDPAKMTYLADELRHSVPGDSRRPGCIHLAWDGDTVYTTHRGNIDNPPFLSGWTLRRDDAQKLAPVQLPALQEPGVSYEGVDAANGLIYVALRRHGLGIYRHDAGKGFSRIGTASGLTNAWGVRVRGTTAFVTDGAGAVAAVDVSDPARPAVVGRLPTDGPARGLAVDGNTLYVTAGSQLLIVDVSDRGSPRVLGRAAVGGSAIRVDYAGGRAYVAAWNDAQVFDVSSPAAPRFIGAARMTRDIGRDDDRPDVTSRTLGVAAHGDTLFAGSWHVIHSFRVDGDRAAPRLVLPEAVNLVDFGLVSAGSRVELPLTVRNQGTAPLTVFDAATDNPAFTVTPRAMRIPPDGSAAFQISYQANDDRKATAQLKFSSDDPANTERGGYLVANQPGVGIGRPLPEITVDLVDGGRWSSTALKGHVALLAYFATF